MTATSVPSITGADLLLDGIRAGSVPADAYLEDATFDGVVPGWRFALRGHTAIAAEYARWFAHPSELHELRRSPTDAGEVLQYTVTWVEDGVPHAARHAHVLTVDAATGRISDDHVWCGGRWSADQLAEMEATG